MHAGVETGKLRSSSNREEMVQFYVWYSWPPMSTEEEEMEEQENALVILRME
jgi:hypothetical protein